MTGTWLFLRAFLRRDRWMYLWWGLGVALLYVSQAWSVDGLYATQEEFDRAAANMVFQLISRRYERGSVILTSNKAFSEWGSVFADDVLATAILDRLLHHCHVISINGPSYRLKDRASLAPTTNSVP